MIDESTQANVREESHLSELYYQWTLYRLDVLAERARLTAQDLRERYKKNVRMSDEETKGGMCRMETVDVPKMQTWADEQIKYIQQTLYEMRPLGQ